MKQIAACEAIEQGFVEFPPLSPFVTLNGPIYARVTEKDVLQLGFIVQRKNSNLNGNCHGAVLFGLLDSVMGASILYLLASEYSVVTLNLSTNFLVPAQVGDLLIGQAEISGSSKSHIFVSGSLKGPNGVVATAVGTFAKIRNKENIFNFRELVRRIVKKT